MAFLIFDPSVSGAAGDMLIAGLMDLCSEKQKNEFCAEFNKNLVNYDPKFSVEWKNVNIHGFSGIQIQTFAEKKFPPSKLQTILNELSHSLLKDEVSKIKANNALGFIVDAEKKIHGLSQDDSHFHFHELATIDTVLDIIGVYYLIEKIEIDNSHMFVLPVSVGGGSRVISHGLVSIPSPATAEIIKKGEIKIQGGPIQEELLTPTGAAILASLQATFIQFLPYMEIEEIGRGFGTKEPKEGKQSFLRIIRGIKGKQLDSEEISILETNVDDVDGETIGYLFDILFNDQLVLDFIVINTIMKKNRPGYLLQAIVKPENVHAVTRILMNELGTLGVRLFTGFRHTTQRTYSKHDVEVKEGAEVVQLKRGYIHDKVISEKVEYEDLKRIARKEKKPLREVRRKINSTIQRWKESDG